ncbi:MAG: hypothetical protein DA329_11915 [Candidatus Nitrosocosmicus sp.]|nr:hypothetical protein [Candidatus Nitrosocosmicus sp.]
MSFLTKTENEQTYLDSLRVRSPHTIQGIKYSLKKFQEFVENTFKGKTIDVFDELGYEQGSSSVNDFKKNKDK